jgi:hypothetical protein
MKLTHGLTLLAITAMWFASPGPARAQESAPPHQEMRAEVPALDEFHTVIRKLWHDAWPNKDYDALRVMLPDIRQRAEDVVQAELPGILRDKKSAWGEAVKELQAVVAEYAAAAEGADNQKLLDAAERLHAQFEKLVRTIRPPLAELDAFHVVLYKLYHYDMPANDLAAIKASVGQLKEPMTALNGASLPKRLESKQKEFAAARKKLSAAVERLVATVRSSNEARIKRAITDLHDRYQALAAVLD